MTFAISISAVGLGMGVLSAVGGAQVAGIQAASSKRGQEAQKALNKAKTEESNSASATQRAMQVINNNRILRVGGKHFDASSQNIVRNADAFVRGSIEQQIGQAESNGAFAANLASKGVGGASSDAIQTTMLLQQSRQRGAAEQNKDYLTYDQAKEQAGIMPTALNSLDMTVYSGSVDNTVVIPEITRGTDYAGIAGSLLSSKLAGAIPDMYAKFTSPTPVASTTGLGVSGNSHYGVNMQQAGMGFFGRSGLSGIKLR